MMFIVKDEQKEEISVIENLTDDCVMKGQFYFETEKEIVVHEDYKISKYLKDDLFKEEIKYDQSVLNCDAVINIVRDLDCISRIVVSRVCKSWYHFVRSAPHYKFDSCSVLPSYSETSWMKILFRVLRNNGIDVTYSSFLYWIFNNVKKSIRKIDDFLDFLLTYVDKKLNAGVALYLSIFYIQMKKSQECLSIDICKEMISIYMRLSKRIRYCIRQRVKKGRVKCTGYSFKKYRDLVILDGCVYGPGSRQCREWNGFESMTPYPRMNSENFQAFIYAKLKRI